MSERTYWRAANGDIQWTAPHHEGTAASLEANPRWERVQCFTAADLAAHDQKVKAEAWDEGHSWGWSDAQEAHDVRQEMDRSEWRLSMPNPHRIESEARP